MKKIKIIGAGASGLLATEGIKKDA